MAKQLGHVELVRVVIALHVLHVIGDWVTGFNSCAEQSHVDDRWGARIVFLRTGWITDRTRHWVECGVICLVDGLQEA